MRKKCSRKTLVRAGKHPQGGVCPSASRRNCCEPYPPATGNSETRNSTFGTRNSPAPGITPELLQQILRRLDEPPLTQPKTANRELATANHPPNQREISAKLPKNKPHSGNISEQYQLNMPCEKNTAKNSSVGGKARRARCPTPPAVNCPLPVELSPPLPKTGNHQPFGTRNSFP